MRVRLVTFELKIAKLEVENIFNTGVYFQFSKGIWLACALEFYLLQVVQVYMRIAQGMDKVARLQIANLRNHAGQQCIRGYVEWYAKKNIGAALVHRAGELSVGHIKLEHNMARR